LRPTVRHCRRSFLGFTVAIAAGACRRAVPFPPETTPEGAYARIALAVADGKPREIFAYLEDEAQWAAHTIRRERATALARARATYPADELAKLEPELSVDANLADGADVFTRIARSRGWVARLRRDLSGVARVEHDGARATIVTARGSRYAMKRRTVGIYGLTMFTAELVDAAEKATRDRARIEEAARDFSAAPGGATDAAAD